jgi:hypothetical protein
MRQMMTGSLNNFCLIALVSDSETRSRLLSGLHQRRLEIVDEMVTPRRNRVLVVGLIGAHGLTNIFISQNQEIGCAPAADDVRRALNRLLAMGRFQEGAAIVLGRSHDNPGDYVGDYPALLRFLSSSDKGDRRLSCAGGIAGIAGSQPSLASSLLWWEYARATTAEPGRDLIQALFRARAGFRSISADWQAARAASAHLKAERHMQYSFLYEPEDLSLDRLRFEVLPTFLMECDATSHETWAQAGHEQSLGWRHLYDVTLQIEGIEPSFGTTPLALRHLDIKHLPEGSIQVNVAADFAARIALGANNPSSSEWLRYSLTGGGDAIGICSPPALAGSLVELIYDPPDLEQSLRLTCSSALGQFAEFEIASNVGGIFADGRGDCDQVGANAAAA